MLKYQLVLPNPDKGHNPLTTQQQTEANEELVIFRYQGRVRACGGCLPDFVQRHEDKLIRLQIEQKSITRQLIQQLRSVMEKNN
jgi:hypothetical protein